MNLKDVQDAVEKIRIDSLDDSNGPQCHIDEDDLYLNLLKAIAAGDCNDPKACAAEAIKVSELEFDRWFE